MAKRSGLTDRPTDSGAAANRSQPFRNPSRGSVGGNFTDPAGEGAPAHRGVRNSPPLDRSATCEHYYGGDSYGMSDGDMDRGFRKLPMPGPNRNSPDGGYFDGDKD